MATMGPAAVTIGVQKTLALLADTANEAAVPVLLAALDAPDRTVQDGALTAILQRRRGAGPRALVQRWSRLSERWKRRIAEHPRLLAPAVRDALLGRNAELCANGCAALLCIQEFDLIPALVTAIEEPGNAHTSLLVETLVSICELLEETLSGPRHKPLQGEPSRVREQVLPSLERAVDRYERHRQKAIVEAFLLLTSQDHPLLQRILSEPRHPAYLVVTDLLRNSPRLAIMRLVINLLESRHAPSVALQVVSHRRDTAFVRQMLQRLAHSASDPLRSNLRRLEVIGWLDGDLGVLDGLTEQEQEMAVHWVMTSRMDRLRAFEVIAHVVRHGHASGRRAAAAAAAEFGGAAANQLVLDGLHDPDPQVQANLVVQLRERGIPGAISRLLQALESPHEVVAKAAQSCLSEFNFNRYITVFDMMEDDIRRSTGLLVLRIDPNSVEQLAAELKAGTRTRRIRGLQVALAMDAVHHVEPLVISLLKDEDHLVRSEAARALAYGSSPLAQQSLREALLDRSVAVREVAEQSLRRLSQAGRVTTASTFASALRTAENNPLVRDAARTAEEDARTRNVGAAAGRNSTGA